MGDRINAISCPKRSDRTTSHVTMRSLLKTTPLLTIFILLISNTVVAGPWRAAEQNSYGWQLMSPKERIEHQTRMRSFTSYEECSEYQAEHHSQLAERARQAGIILQPKAQSACDQLQRRGQLK